MNLTDLTDILVRAAGLPAGTDLSDDTRPLADAGIDSLAYLQLQAEIGRASCRERVFSSV